MLQIKTWSWNTHKLFAKDIEKDLNKWFKTHKCKHDTFEMFMLDHGIMFARVMYITAK